MNKETNQENLRNQILDLLDVLKAKEIKTLDITTKSSFADFLIICEGTSSRHVSSIVNKISRDSFRALRRPGSRRRRGQR